jgi:POT family proton-dependent oligopeptide transporter
MPSFLARGLAKTTFPIWQVYCFIALFWALYDQSGSAWVQQAEHMDRYFLGVQWLPSQVQVETCNHHA